MTLGYLLILISKCGQIHVKSFSNFFSNNLFWRFFFFYLALPASWLLVVFVSSLENLSCRFAFTFTTHLSWNSQLLFWLCCPIISWMFFSQKDLLLAIPYWFCEGLNLSATQSIWLLSGYKGFRDLKYLWGSSENPIWEALFYSNFRFADRKVYTALVYVMDLDYLKFSKYLFMPVNKIDS